MTHYCTIDDLNSTDTGYKITEYQSTSGNAQKEKLKNFVQNAYICVHRIEKEEAPAEFNNPSGDFISGELYIFANEMNGTVLSSQYQPYPVGANHWSAEDITGVEIVQHLIAGAKTGGGMMYSPVLDSITQHENYLLNYIEPTDKSTYSGRIVIQE